MRFLLFLFTKFERTNDNIYSFLWNGNLYGMQLKAGATVPSGASTSKTINGITFTGAGYNASTNFTASVAGTWYYPSNSVTAATHANANQAVTTGAVSYLAFIPD